MQLRRYFVICLTGIRLLLRSAVVLSLALASLANCKPQDKAPTPSLAIPAAPIIRYVAPVYGARLYRKIGGETQQIKVLPFNSRVEIIGYSPECLKINAQFCPEVFEIRIGETRGLVVKFSLAEKLQTMFFKVTPANGLNLRAAPSLTAAILITLPQKHHWRSTGWQRQC